MRCVRCVVRPSSRSDIREHMLERVAEMVLDVMTANGLEVDDFISVIFTATSDLDSEFPAYAARRLGFGDVPLICARELEIEGSMPRVVRMLAHVETDLPRADITHVYLHGAAALRRDLTRVREVPDERALTGPVLRRRRRPARYVDRAGAAPPGRRRRAARRQRREPADRQRRSAPRTVARRPTSTPQLVVVAVPPDHLAEAIVGGARRTRARWSPTSAASRARRWPRYAGRAPEQPGALRRQPPDGRQRAVRAARRLGRAVRRPAVGGHAARALRRRRRSSWSTALAEACGATPVRLTPEEHDQAVARTSHLPHLLAALAAGRLADAPRRAPRAVRPGRARRDPDRGRRPGAVAADHHREHARR